MLPYATIASVSRIADSLFTVGDSRATSLQRVLPACGPRFATRETPAVGCSASFPPPRPGV